MMFSGYTTIWLKLRQSFKAFPYLSQQSRIARSRQKVIKMLFVLIIIELICWAPWQIYIIIEFIFRHLFDVSDTGILPYPEVRFFSWIILEILLNIRIFQWWSNYLQPGLDDVKYWFIFFNSALNPFIYGYNNQTMQKAFRITFTCIFKDKVNK